MLVTTMYRNIISVIFLIYLTMYPYAKTGAEICGYDITK